MATRTIVKRGDEVLTKVCRPVENFDKKLHDLLDDMAQTMYKANGVGLAGPQVGMLRRLFVVDIGEGLIEAINPEIIAADGEQENTEGCLSCPGIIALTRRPERLTLKAQNRYGEAYILEAEGFLAQALSHENDHLDGKTIYETAVRMLSKEEYEQLLEEQE